MLLEGGNAVDAAVATAAALNVVEPYMSGIGGDGLMMLALADGSRKGLDYVGPAPAGARLELYREDPTRGERGPLSPLVPGNGGGWLAALEAHGTMDRATVFGPALGYAEGGFPLSPKNVSFIEGALPRMDEDGKRRIAPNGRPPRTGEWIKQPELARTFRDVDPESPNVVGPGRRLAMCVAPAHVYQEGRLAVAIGTPGGYGILQTTPQMLVNLLDFGMNVQEAIEAPRFRCVLPMGEDMRYFSEARPTAATGGTGVMIEGRYPAESLAELERRGHRVERLAEWTPAVGGGHGVTVDATTGARAGGADPRRDGAALGH